MAIKKWDRLTPHQIENLDKDTTIVVFPLGTMGSSDEKTRVGADLRVVEGEAKEVAEAITAAAGPLAGFKAVSLPALWAGVEPGPNQAGTIALPQAIYEGAVEAICFSLKRQGIKYLALVVRDNDVDAAARSIAGRLNQAAPQPWVVVYNPMHKPPLASIPGDVCRALCAILGCNPANCPP